MNTDNKYPNADTSAERLKWIEKHMEMLALLPEKEWSINAQVIRDLLAMLQERHNYKQEYTKCVEAASVFQSGGELSYLMEFVGQSTTLDGPRLAAAEIKQLRQQLHDQRWRRFTEKPETFPIQVMFENLDPIHLYSEQAVPKGVLEKSWWRPILPLPKE